MIQNLKDLEDQLIRLPEPSYKFEIGDEVCIGNLYNIIVSQIYFDGKGYEITYSSTEHNYGRSIEHHNQKRIVTWLDIRKKHNNRESFIQNEGLRLHYSQRSLTDILIKVYYFGLDNSPEYQRDYVWDSEDKIQLIDSIFKNIDIGKFVFNERRLTAKDDLYEVIDGKQRINAICEFYEDRFQYKGKYFSDLSRRDQNHFEDYPISYASVNKATEKEIIEIFIMLNTSGKVMDKVHLNRIKELYKIIEN